jgi:predicted ATPase
LLALAGVREALVAELLSLSATLPELSLTPQRKKEKTLEVLLGRLDELIRRRPVLMVFEDVHWIDPTSRELLDLTVERIRALPVLLIITFRPEFQERWSGPAYVSTLALNRLDAREGTALAETVAGKALPQKVVAQISARTGGVPLFVEELTRTIIESGLLRDEGDRYALDHLLPPRAIPASLNASLLARLDRLGPTAKEIAQSGAAWNRSPIRFWSVVVCPAAGAPAHVGACTRSGPGSEKASCTSPGTARHFVAWIASRRRLR